MMFDQVGGGTKTKPEKAPPAPKRTDKSIAKKTMNAYKRAAASDSTRANLLYSSGGMASAPAPTTSRTAKLFATRGM